MRLSLWVFWEGGYGYFGKYVGILGYGVCCFGYVWGKAFCVEDSEVVFGFGNA